MSEVLLVADAFVPATVRLGDLFENQLGVVQARCVHDVVRRQALVARSGVEYPFGLRGRIRVQITGQAHGHAGHHMVAELRITADRERRLIWKVKKEIVLLALKSERFNEVSFDLEGPFERALCAMTQPFNHIAHSEEST